MSFAFKLKAGVSSGVLVAWRMITLTVTLLMWSGTTEAALPQRLVILLDGVSYFDVKAMQEGTLPQAGGGMQSPQRAFDRGYFPVSRLVSTFPSASDVAWTEILGNPPLPGYQRTYLSAATQELVRQNGVTTSMEYELQMHWQLENGFLRALGYVQPHSSFKHEMHELTRAFLKATNGPPVFYSLIRSSDDAQHTSGNIYKLLSILDRELQKLCATYRQTEGHDLEILILSDHGNNHAGAGKRVRIQSFLKQAGYRISNRLFNEHDVVLPTVGIQNWIEVNCQPAEVEPLAMALSNLEGVDLVTARLPDQPGRFLIINTNGDRATIDWKTETDSFRYQSQTGDPFNYKPVVAVLGERGQLDVDGFASAKAWMDATLTNHYPLALERIARGHSVIAVNTAPILIALQDGYVHSSWLLKQMSSLMKMGGTHGGLDDVCSSGMLLSNFTPTKDTSTRRVAAQFDGFQGLKDPRAGRKGAEWVYPTIQTVASVGKGPFAYENRVPLDEPLLLVWTPAFADADNAVSLEIVIRREPRFESPRVRRTDPKPADHSVRSGVFKESLMAPEPGDCERIFRLPDEWRFEPSETYCITGRAQAGKARSRIFSFTFQTDSFGLPVVH